MNHETKSVALGVRNVVKYVLVLMWTIVWGALLFFTDVASSFGGTSKGQAFALAVVTGIPFVIVYAIVAPLASWLATRALARTGR